MHLRRRLSVALLLSLLVLGGCSLLPGRGDEARFDPYPTRVRGCPAAAVRGMYRPGVVDGVASAHLDALLSCLPESEDLSDDEVGEVSLALLVSRGEVCAVRPVASSLDPDLEACLVEEVRDWGFPVLREDAEAFVRLRVQIRRTARGPGLEVNEVRP